MRTAIRTKVIKEKIGSHLECEASELRLIEQIDPASLDPERIVNLSGHPDRVLAELRRRHLAGKSMLPPDIQVEDAALFLSAHDAFPSYHAALLQVGIPMQSGPDLIKADDHASAAPESENPSRPDPTETPIPTPGPLSGTPPKKRQYIRWTEEMLLAYLRATAPSLKSMDPKEVFGSSAARMVRFCKDKFGSYDEALRRAGLEPGPDKSLIPAPTTQPEERAKLLEAVAAFAEEPWDQESVTQFRRSWGKRVKATFGGWSQVAAELEIPEWKLSPNRMNYLRADPDLALDLLRDRQEAGEPVDSASVSQEDHELWRALTRCFGEYEAALLQI